MTSSLSTSEFISNNIDEASAGGASCITSTDNQARLSGAAPQPRSNTYERPVIYRCDKCGSEDVLVLVWAHGNTGEILEWNCDVSRCRACSKDCLIVRDYGFGFELWREAEWCDFFLTFDAALAEAKESDRAFEIIGAKEPEETNKHVPRFEMAVLPRLNKQPTLADVKQEIRRSSYTTRVRVDASNVVNDEAWRDLTENFLSRRDVWAGHGGVDSSFEAPEALAKIDVTNWPEEERKRWMAQSFLLVIEIVHGETGERFYVDPQGYDYARYVGVPK